MQKANSSNKISFGCVLKELETITKEITKESQLMVDSLKFNGVILNKIKEKSST